MKSIEINYFRCFKHLEVNFKPGINLLIGINGSGKTSLLRACKQVLSSFFVGFSDNNTRWNSFVDNDYTRLYSKDGLKLPVKPIEIKFNMDDSFDPDVFEKPYPYGKTFKLYKSEKKNSRLAKGQLGKFCQFGMELHKHMYNLDLGEQIYPLPLFASFSTEDIHSSKKLSHKQFREYHPQNTFGYIECLSSSGLFRFWKERLLTLKEAETREIEIEIVTNSLLKAFRNEFCDFLKGISIRPNAKEVYFIFKDGREVSAGMLSDGYKRVVNIIMDLAFRCALLNGGIYGQQAPEKTRGTVLIDEIDMHLHPQLQATILKSIREAFPQLQIIATTHAPMVMSGVPNDEDDEVFQIAYSQEEGYTYTNSKTYGLDISTLVESEFKLKPRDLTVDKELSDMYELIDGGKIAEARDELRRLKEKYGEYLPDLARAEAMLNFM